MATFSPRELDIMKILWERGPSKPADIQNGLPYEMNNSALRWQLGQLIEDGHVKRRKKGKAFHYSAETVPRQAFGKLSRRLADVFFGGSSLAMIGELMREENLSLEDIEELRAIAEGKGDTEQSPIAKEHPQ